MKATLEYLSRRNQELIATNYRGQSCWLIAVETASKLIEDGLRPHIETTYKPVRRGGNDCQLEEIFPRFLRGKEWVTHNVCCTDDEAFDPLIGKPVPKRDYCMILFGEPIDMEQTYSEEEILKLYRERQEEGK
jgi:hypothetical protein